MPEDKAKGVVPPLRFPEFRNTGPWEVKRLGEVSEVLDSMRRPVTSSKRNPGPYPYYGASGIIDYIDDYIFDERLLLIGEDGAKWGPFEKTAFIVEGKYWVNNHAHVLRPFAINDVLLENYLNAIDIAIYVTGAAPPKLTLDNLKSIRIPIPPVEKEQQKIADCLSSLDDLIRAEGERLEALKEHKKGLMQRLFPREGQTTPDLRFPEFRNSGPWEVKRLGDVLTFQNGFPFSSKYFNEIGNGIRLIRNADLKSSERTVFYSGPYDKRYVVSNGDVLVGMDGDFSPSIWSNGKSLLNQRVGRIYAKKNNILTFLYYILAIVLKDIEQRTAQTTVKHLSHLEVEEAKWPIPDISEQQKIADCLSSLDDLIRAQEARIEALKQHKKGLMQQLFPQEVN